jgi:hypothetical protein
MTLQQARDHINNILAQYQHRGPAGALVSPTFDAGKVYEAWVLANVLGRLASDEGLSVVLVGGSRISLRSSPGLLDRSYPHFQVSDSVRQFEVFTDVEFETMSRTRRGSPFGRGDYHELDIAVVDPTVGDLTRPPHTAIYLAVECKDTPFQKRMLREALGIRREFSLLRGRQPTAFKKWPRPHVPAVPASCLLVYTTDRAAPSLWDPADLFGLNLEVLAAP